MRLLILTFLLLITSDCNGQEVCKAGRPAKTPAGELSITRCTDPQKYPTKKYVSVGGIKLLESSYLSDEDFDKNRARWIFRGNSLQETGCPDRLFLVDLSKKPVRVFAFGIKKSCNEFQDASWGERRSIIRLKNNVEFIYENGKMTLPAAGEKLWKSIKAPHAGAGLELKYATAFSEKVLRPK